MAELTPGRYIARALRWEFGRSSRGNEQVAVVFQIASGEHAGRCLTWYGAFTEKTVERTLDSLQYCGWDGRSLREMRGMGTQDVELDVQIERSPVDQRERLRVKWVNKVGGGFKEKLSTADIGALDQRLKGYMLARHAAPAAPAGDAGKYAPEPEPDYPYLEEPPF